MLSRLWEYLKQQLVADTPNEISACLDCGQVSCALNKFRTCPVRLTHARALDADDTARSRHSRGAPAED